MSTPSPDNSHTQPKDTDSLEDAPNRSPEVSAFSYGPLPTATSIRVLTMADSTREEICCEMHVVDLEDEPDFVALSYTWGNPITVREKPMPDLDSIKMPEEAYRLPFMYEAIGPEEYICGRYDCTKRDYFLETPLLYRDFSVGVPYEEVAWEETTCSIELNGSKVEVKKNLFDFLARARAWRNTLADEGGRHRPPGDYLNSPLWVDALCIDQSNFSERASQVQLMSRIYKSARGVMGWLGPRDNLGDLGYEAINKILDFAASASGDFSQGQSMGENDMKSLEPLNQSLWSLSRIRGMHTANWFGLFCILQRLWFRRAWVAQEVVFSKHVILMYDGVSMFSMDFLLAAVSFLELHGLDHDLCTLGENMLTGRPLSDTCKLLGQLATFDAVRQSSASSIPVVPRLQIEPRGGQRFVLGQRYVRQRLQLEGRGSVYIGPVSAEEEEETGSRWLIGTNGEFSLYDHDMEISQVEDLGIPGYTFHMRPVSLLLALASFRYTHSSDPRDKVFAFLNLAEDKLGQIPDYTASVQDVYVAAAQAIVEKTGTLALLSHVQDLSETVIQNLPRWVPDFSARPAREPLDPGAREERFCASKWLHSPMQINKDGTLSVTGYQVCTIQSIAQLEVETVPEVLRLLLKVPPMYPAYVADGKKGYSRRINRLEALWRTLIADRMVMDREDTYSLDGLSSLRSGFVHWIITDLADAFCAYLDYQQISVKAKELSREYLRVRFSLWSAVYEGRHIRDTMTDSLTLEELFNDLAVKAEREIDDMENLEGNKESENRDSGPNRPANLPIAKPDINDIEDLNSCEDSTDSDSESSGPTNIPTIKHETGEIENAGNSDDNDSGCIRPIDFPTAEKIRELFCELTQKLVIEVDKAEAEADEDETEMDLRFDNVHNRLTQRWHRVLRNFENHKRRGTDGRVLFCTAAGLLGLGPPSTGQDSSKKDEIWILSGAKVPFILRQIEGKTYNIIGEAYLHGFMYGESCVDPEDPDDWERLETIFLA